MRRSFTSHTTRPTHRFLPRLETLESRWCPSAAGIFQHGHTLLIQGDGAADSISVSDNGLGGITASITLAGGTKTLTATSIATIEIDAGSGDDTVNYALTGALSQRESLKLNLGKGADQATLDFSASLNKAELAVSIHGGSGSNQLATTFGAITGSRVNLAEWLGASGSTSHVNFGGALNGSDATVHVYGGAGNDQVSSTVGDASNSNIQFFANLGKGANSFDLEAAGNLQNSVVHYDIYGGAGGNTITFNAKGVNLDTTSRLNLQSFTGAGADNVTVNYSGVMDGELDLTPYAGAGNDTVDVTLTLAQRSSGRIHGRVHGEGGNDTMTYDVYDNSNPGGKSMLALLDAVLFGGAGNNTLNATSNVKVVK